jgi:hypothetical protein
LPEHDAVIGPVGGDAIIAADIERVATQHERE